METRQIHFRERLLRPERQSVPIARGFVRGVLCDWQRADRLDEVLLCVSELATNALLHGMPPGRAFRLALWLTAESRLRVEVRDSGDGQPRARTGLAAEAEHGRGLLLVATLADAWGVRAGEPGKAVWCEFG
ncbi:ATP-binding protein [Streptomyces oceani]|uniref:ATPase n=1 Tax=Streptomyces oceani TaxID=1075402 RepID=A0A1E7KGJ2_9ACTN|nr:ATP-binding protein [Streptomyces oceani]OEV02993.1 ATPase [Streptomyces oceani]